ncbi:CAP domain-containing protein [Gilvimarinus agarilyticus]|uniref:CAP domain-containing protein n=1 Tax=Gilvimarinus agarilyticus TaxID=679259 RepID=UPI000696D7D1|nr:CAP domain-containing protein [Gilvimarinus agarilyticus]
MVLDWLPVSGAEAYEVFYASEAGIAPENIGAYRDGDWQSVAQPPLTISGLSNQKTYYFVVAATLGDNAGDVSSELSATPSQPSAALSVSAGEAMMLELVNRARFAPAAEASRFGIDLNEGLAPGTLSAEQRPPLAYNELLIRAARGHSQWMLDTDTFSHTGVADSSAAERIAAEGYSLSGSWAAGENISVSGASSTPDVTAAAISQHQGLFESPGHRQNILNSGYRELGVGQRVGEFEFEGYGALPSSMITQKFARHGSDYFVSGVVYRDDDNNGRYSAGEGIGNVTVSVGDASTMTNGAGAYTIARSSGGYTVAAFGPGVDLVSDVVTLSNANKKVDVIVSGSSSQLQQW